MSASLNHLHASISTTTPTTFNNEILINKKSKSFQEQNQKNTNSCTVQTQQNTKTSSKRLNEKKLSASSIVNRFKSPHKISRQYKIVDDESVGLKDNNKCNSLKRDEDNSIVINEELLNFDLSFDNQIIDAVDHNNTNNKLSNGSNRFLTTTTNTLLTPHTNIDSSSLYDNHSLNIQTPTHESLSRKSSTNSVRFTKYANNVNTISSGNTVLSHDNSQNFLNTTTSLDLTSEAELLEHSAKKNDKYTVRRILDANYTQFQLKSLNNKNRKKSHDSLNNKPRLNTINYLNDDVYHQLLCNQINLINNNFNQKSNHNSHHTRDNSMEKDLSHKQTPLPQPKFAAIPAVFLNILHLAIEHKAIDVLRICLKYGLNANEPGTNEKFFKLTNTTINENNSKTTIKYPFKCTYCAKKHDTTFHDVSFNAPPPPSPTSTVNPTHKNKFVYSQEGPKSDMHLNQTTTQQMTVSPTTEETDELVNYSNYDYLIRLPPLFLSISRCFHNATELLLQYGACTNIQDPHGNTPLHLAASKRVQCEQCVHLLIKYHASALIRNNLSQNAVSILFSLKSPIIINKIHLKIINDIFINNLNFASQLTNPQMFNITTSSNIGTMNSASSNISGYTSIIGACNKESNNNTSTTSFVTITNKPTFKQAATKLLKNSGNSLTNTLISASSVKNMLDSTKKSLSTLDMIQNEGTNISKPKSTSSDLMNKSQLQPSTNNIKLQLSHNDVTTNHTDLQVNLLLKKSVSSQSNAIITTPIRLNDTNGTIIKQPSDNTKTPILIIQSSSPNRVDSRQLSGDADTNNKHDNVSMVSSKMSLFKKFSTNTIANRHKLHNGTTLNEIKNDNYESLFKIIFNELEKFSWNIECAAKIMDLLQIHLKDLLQTIKCAHNQYIQQTSHLNQQQQQQQTNNAPQISTNSTTSNNNNNNANVSSSSSQLIYKLEELLITLIHTCYDDLTHENINDASTNPLTQSQTDLNTNKSKNAQQSQQQNELLSTTKKRRFQLYTRKLLQISLEILLQSNIPSMQYISLTTINRLYDVYVYHNLFNPGIYHSYYIPSSKRIKSKLRENRKTNEFNNTDASNINETAATVSFSDHLYNNDYYHDEIVNNSNNYNTGPINTVNESDEVNILQFNALNTATNQLLNNHKQNETTYMQTQNQSEQKSNLSKTVTEKLTGFLKRFSRDALVDLQNSNTNITNLDPNISQTHSRSSSKVECPSCNNTSNLQQKQNHKNQNELGKLKKVSQEVSNDDEFVTSVLIGTQQSKVSDTQQNNKDTKQAENTQNQTEDQTNATTLQNLNLPFQFIAFNIEPKLLLTIIQERLEAHKSEYGNRVRCVPSVRTINCQHHCVAIMAARLFTILCNEQLFQQKLIYETHEICFNLIVELLNPNNDPHLLCLILQALGLLALRPEYHETMIKYDLPDTIMSLILPGDELYYTNQTTKYAKYVKHLAARILVYLGLFSKVSNKVNLFDILEINADPIEHDKSQTFENNFIHYMAVGEHVVSSTWMMTAAISIEKLLDDILKEIKNSNSTSSKIQFGFNNKNENLIYNLSYLCSIVHPIIILRLLEHRLFTPLSRKTTKSSGNQKLINKVNDNSKLSTFNNKITATKLSTSSSFPINYDLLSSTTNETSSKLGGKLLKKNILRKSSEGNETAASTSLQTAKFTFKDRLTPIKSHKSNLHLVATGSTQQIPTIQLNTSSFMELSELMKDSELPKQRTRHNSTKSSSRTKNNVDNHVKTSISNLNLKLADNNNVNKNENTKEQGAKTDNKDSIISMKRVSLGNVSSNINKLEHLTYIDDELNERNSAAPYKSPSSSTYFFDLGKKFLKRVNSGNQLTALQNKNSQQKTNDTVESIKEFEKKLINLPTFAISSEYASNTLVPIASSNTLDIVRTSRIISPDLSPIPATNDESLFEIPAYVTPVKTTNEQPKIVIDTDKNAKNVFLEKKYEIVTYNKKKRRQSDSYVEAYKVAMIKRNSCSLDCLPADSIETTTKTSTDCEDEECKIIKRDSSKKRKNRAADVIKRSIENLLNCLDTNEVKSKSAINVHNKNQRLRTSDDQTRRVRSTSPYAPKSKLTITDNTNLLGQSSNATTLYDIESIKSSEESTNSAFSVGGLLFSPTKLNQSPNINKLDTNRSTQNHFFPSMEPLQSQQSIDTKSEQLNESSTNDSTKSNANQNSNLNNKPTESSKPGSEVLTLISTWIKNAPNDFLDTRVLDELRTFFNQLENLKSSFRPWTSKLKRILKLDELENFKEAETETIYENIAQQYQHMQHSIVSGKLPCSIDECTTLAAIQLRILELKVQDESINQNVTALTQTINESDEAKPSDSLINKNNSTTCCGNLYCFNISYTNERNNLLNKKTLICPCYYKVTDVMKLVKMKKERLSKTSYYDNEMKLKEFYVKICKNLCCYGSILFQVKEISTAPVTTSSQNTYPTIRKVKRILAIKSNKISIVDNKTKALIRTQRMSDLKSWYSGDGTHLSTNYGPAYLFKTPSQQTTSDTVSKSANVIATRQVASFVNESYNIDQILFNKKECSIDINRLFIIEFCQLKWYFYIDDYLTLKSITSLLLDQSLDLGIDNNPLMLDLTISEHYHNKKNFYQPVTKRTLITTTNNSSKNNIELSSIANGNSSASVVIDIDASSDGLHSSQLQTSDTNHSSAQKNANIKLIQTKNQHIMTTNSNMSGFFYAKEFEELQVLLLWFPEEVAFRLTQFEYNLFKNVQPIEYLRHVALDINNLKFVSNRLNISSNQKQTTVQSIYTVQDLIVRYKEVSSWIKKLIQSQESPDKRLAFTYASIRCAITCWNIGNFNSAREIWLGLKTALVNQNEDIAGMNFLNSAFDSSNFIKSNATIWHQAPNYSKTNNSHLTNHHNNTSNNNSSTNVTTTTTQTNQAFKLALNRSALNRTYCSKTQIYCEALSKALDIPTCKVIPFFGTFLHDFRQILDGVPSQTIMCNKNVQKPIEMVSDINGQENFFTRISVGGMLNTRKLDLAHMLIKDINMFHTHPNKTETTLYGFGDYKTVYSKSIIKTPILSSMNYSANSNTNSNSKPLTVHKPYTLIHNPIKINIIKTSTSSSSITTTSNNELNELTPTKEKHFRHNSLDTSRNTSTSTLRRDSNTTLVSVKNNYQNDDSKSELILENETYYALKTSSIYEPIRDSDTDVRQHNVSYIPMDDSNLDYHSLQCLQNGFTFIVGFSEYDLIQSNYLLNLRVELNNCTLTWSKPQWDFVNTTYQGQSPVSPNAQVNQMNGSNGNNLNGTKPNIRASIVNNPLLATLDSSTVGLSEGFLRKKFNQLSSGNVANGSSIQNLNSNEFFNVFDTKSSINSLIKHHVQREFVNLDCLDGFLDLNYVKHIRLGCLDMQIFNTLQLIARKYSINQFDQSNIISIVYGSTFAENKTIYIIGSQYSTSMCFQGLDFIINSLMKQKAICDKRIKWLKDLYLSLFYEGKRFQGSTPMEAIIAFGGRQFNFHLLDNQLNSSITSLVSNGGMSEYDGSNFSQNINLNSQIPASQRKLTANSIIPFAIKSMRSTRRAVKSEVLSKDFKASDATLQTQNNIDMHQLKSYKAIEHIAKMKSFKNKSIVSEFFTRSSSGSLERQASCDSCGTNSHNLQIHLLANAHNQNRRILNQFKPPLIFNLSSLSTHTLPNLNNHQLLHLHNKYQSSSSSGVSTLKSTTTRSKNSLLTKQNSIGCSHHQQNLTPNYNSHTIFDHSQSSNGCISTTLYDSYMEFSEFVELFKSFYIHMRKDLKDIYDRYAILINCKDDENSEKTINSMLKYTSTYTNSIELANTLTRNSSVLNDLKNQPADAQNQLLINNNNRLFYDLISSNSISPYSVNCSSELLLLHYYSHSSMQTTTSSITREFYAITLKQFKEFLEIEQGERCLKDTDIEILINRHETNPFYRSRNLLSYVGFARFLLDKENFILNDVNTYKSTTKVSTDDAQMSYPLSFYYIASSHNTYLTGHQLKGESSAEIYRVALKSGCRCVELDVWDGDDGWPVVYHGRTLTSKVPFKVVVEVINESAFTTSPYPVILSIENRCSLQQQVKMAQIFTSVFGDKLVKNYLFESDLYDEPLLPSPNQLKYKILIKNKKIQKQTETVSTKQTPSTPVANTKQRIISNLTNNVILNLGKATSADDNDVNSQIAPEDIDNEDFIEDEWPNENAGNNTTVQVNGKNNKVDGKVKSKPVESKSNKNSLTTNNIHKSQSLTESTFNGIHHKKSNASNNLLMNLIDINSKRSKNRNNSFEIPNENNRRDSTLDIVAKIKNSTSTDLNDANNITNAINNNVNMINAAAAKKAKFVVNNQQIAQELSELVVYTQAVKFRDLNLVTTTYVSNTNMTSSSLMRQTNRKLSTNITSFNNIASKSKTNITVNINMTPQLVPQQSISSSGTDGSKTDLLNLKSKNENFYGVSAEQANTPYSHQVTSMNESKAKQVCKKRTYEVITHTETQLIRCYPNARRFDSSNFSPIQIWACGIQLAALNYQTTDTWQILNCAFFEQNGNLGYVLKPPVLWNKQYPEYGKFNPFEKKKDGEYVSFYLKLISGQYLFENQTQMSTSSSNNSNNSAHHRQFNDLLQTTSTFIEVEIIGIQCDCAKEKTKTFNKNALNPIWNEEFTFHIVFPDLAFIKFTVIDSNNNHVILQRILPIKSLKQGFRHVRLRSLQNISSDLSSLFMYTKQTVEHVQYSTSQSLNNTISSNNTLNIFNNEYAKPQTKHKYFKVTIYGISTSDEDDENSNYSLVVKVTQDTTVLQAIEQALVKAEKFTFDLKDYILVEEMENGWATSVDNMSNTKRANTQSSLRNKSIRSIFTGSSASNQNFNKNDESMRQSGQISKSVRVLQNHEKIMEAQNKWTGNGRFIIKNKSKFVALKKDSEVSKQSSVINDYDRKDLLKKDKKNDEFMEYKPIITKKYSTQLLPITCQNDNSTVKVELNAQINSVADLIRQCLKITKMDESVNDYCLKEITEYIDSKTNSIRVKLRTLSNSENIDDLIKGWSNTTDVKIKVMLAKCQNVSDCQPLNEISRSKSPIRLNFLKNIDSSKRNTNKKLLVRQKSIEESLENLNVVEVVQREPVIIIDNMDESKLNKNINQNIVDEDEVFDDDEIIDDYNLLPQQQQQQQDVSDYNHNSKKQQKNVKKQIQHLTLKRILKLKM